MSFLFRTAFGMLDVFKLKPGCPGVLQGKTRAMRFSVCVSVYDWAVSISLHPRIGTCCRLISGHKH